MKAGLGTSGPQTDSEPVGHRLLAQLWFGCPLKTLNIGLSNDQAIPVLVLHSKGVVNRASEAVGQCPGLRYSQQPKGGNSQPSVCPRWECEPSVASLSVQPQTGKALISTAVGMSPEVTTLGEVRRAQEDKRRRAPGPGHIPTGQADPPRQTQGRPRSLEFQPAPWG